MELKDTPIFLTSTDAKTLAKMLRDAAIGDVVTYAAMNLAIGRNVSKDAIQALATARRIVQREDRMVFDVVRGTGLKRLSDEEIVDLSDKTREHIRRTSKRTAKKLTCVEYDSLSREKQVKHNTSMSMLGVFSELSSDKSMKRLTEQVQEAGTDLPVVKASIAALGAI